MMEPFVGEISMFCGNFAPTGWALCNGQLLPINQNQALFSILGTTYGGDGKTTFGLPDLRGRVPMHAGNGPGLSPRNLGESSGTETVALTVQQIPLHTHPLMGSGQPGATDNPEGALPAAVVDSSGTGISAYSSQPNTAMSPQAIGPSGGGQPHTNLQPYQCINFIIALDGVYPSRS